MERFPGIEAADLSIVIWGDELDESGVKGETHEESIANATLMAAAPDLLEALEVIKTIATEPSHGRALITIEMIATNAIAKAKGETP
jgi:hypothetical protein